MKKITPTQAARLVDKGVFGIVFVGPTRVAFPAGQDSKGRVWYGDSVEWLATADWYLARKEVAATFQAAQGA